MLESTFNASDMLGGMGAIAQPARKTRRRASGAVSDAIDSQGLRRITGALSGGTQTGAIVESMSDAGLVELVLNGDQDVFAVLVERYKDAVQNLAYRMLGNTTEAEDVTQETFVRAYTQLATYKSAH